MANRKQTTQQDENRLPLRLMCDSNNLIMSTEVFAFSFCFSIERTVRFLSLDNHKLCNDLDYLIFLSSFSDIYLLILL